MHKIEKFMCFILTVLAVGTIGITFWSLVVYPSNGVGW